MPMTPSIWGGSMMMRRRPLMGMRRTHRRRGRGVGDVTLGDIWKRIAPAAKALAGHSILSKIGGRRRRHRRHRGMGSMSLFGRGTRRMLGMRRRRRRGGSYAKSGYGRRRRGRRRLLGHRLGGRIIAGGRRRRRLGRGPIGSVLGHLLGGLGGFLPF